MIFRYYLKIIGTLVIWLPPQSVQILHKYNFYLSSSCTDTAWQYSSRRRFRARWTGKGKILHETEMAECGVDMCGQSSSNYYSTLLSINLILLIFFLKLMVCQNKSRKYPSSTFQPPKQASQKFCYFSDRC